MNWIEYENEAIKIFMHVPNLVKLIKNENNWSYSSLKSLWNICIIFQELQI